MKIYTMTLKEGYELKEEYWDGCGCNNGQYPRYWVLFKGKVVREGITCRCGKGCSNTDCVRDDWGYHDTVIEEYRGEDIIEEDDYVNPHANDCDMIYE
jgi:hypothetical protein